MNSLPHCILNIVMNHLNYKYRYHTNPRSKQTSSQTRSPGNSFLKIQIVWKPPELWSDSLSVQLMYVIECVSSILICSHA